MFALTNYTENTLALRKEGRQKTNEYSSSRILRLLPCYVKLHLARGKRNIALAVVTHGKY